MELYQSIGASTAVAADDLVGDLPIAQDVLLAVAPGPEIRSVSLGPSWFQAAVSEFRAEIRALR